MGEEENSLPQIRIPERLENATPRIKLSKRRDSELALESRSLGQLFWDKLSPEKQMALEQPIRKIEQSIAKFFPENYDSPLIAKTASFPNDQLERQTDVRSCTYVATANGLRILDQPREEYLRDGLKARIEQLTGQISETLNPRKLEAIFASGSPYNQFNLRKFEQPKVRMPSSHPEMMSLFRSLQNGDIAVAAWRMLPTAIRQQGYGHISHARTIVGFSRRPNETIVLHVIDPYGARQEELSFRDWVVASRMNTYFDNPFYDEDSVRKVAEIMGQRNGMMGDIANDVWVIHKKQPKIVLNRDAS